MKAANDIQNPSFHNRALKDMPAIICQLLLHRKGALRQDELLRGPNRNVTHSFDHNGQLQDAVRVQILDWRRNKSMFVGPTNDGLQGVPLCFGLDRDGLNLRLKTPGSQAVNLNGLAVVGVHRGPVATEISSQKTTGGNGENK